MTGICLKYFSSDTKQHQFTLKVMTRSHFRIYGGLFQHILPLYIARALIELHQPMLDLYQSAPIWIAAIRMSLSVAWYDHVPEGKALVTNQFCYVMIKEVLKPLGLQPKDGCCGRLTQSIPWVIGILTCGCLGRYLRLSSVYYNVKREILEFWNALIHQSLSLFALAKKVLRS